ncbi:MAG TPA: alpha/beta fold hydrolase [Mycobacteriales bacterium]|jgi:pimeloyl-ACP methyl ester carboxylesterase|nr:alpha/beta fold hydrolase [Mycobacteriales bacterium]
MSAENESLSDVVAGAVAEALPDSVTQSSFDPVPAPAPDEPAWWGRPFGEIRWQAELARLLVDPVYAGRGVPRGDGGPVLLIPGFLAGDSSLSVMSGWLRRIGHAPYAAGIATNVDCSDRAVDRLERTLLRLHLRTGRQVALVGHSRGGHFAKALAARHPDGVRAVVSLGAGLDEPFDISLPTKAAVALVRNVLRHVDPSTARRGCLTTTCDCPFVRDYTAPFPADVPITSVWTKGDGVVRWRSCVVPYARSVQVRGSHVGLAFNRHAYRAIADALAP